MSVTVLDMETVAALTSVFVTKDTLPTTAAQVCALNKAFDHLTQKKQKAVLCKIIHKKGSNKLYTLH